MKRNGQAVILRDGGRRDPAIPVNIPGAGSSWLSQKDADAINQMTGGALCSLTGGIACPNAEGEIANNVKSAVDIVQWAFFIKTLVVSGVSLAGMAAIIRKNPDDVAKMAAKVIEEGCYKTGECKIAAEALLNEFEKNGVKGIMREIKGVNNMPIVKAGQATGEAVAAGGQSHYGVQVGDMIYEMNSTKGIPIAEWASMYETAVGAKAVPTVLVPLPQ